MMSEKAWDKMDVDLDVYLRADERLSPYGIRHREELIKAIEDMHDRVVKFRGSNSRYAQIINDLTLSLGLSVDGEEMDAEDPTKLRNRLKISCAAIGKPRTMEELAAILGLGEQYEELARKHDAELKNGDY